MHLAIGRTMKLCIRNRMMIGRMDFHKETISSQEEKRSVIPNAPHNNGRLGITRTDSQKIPNTFKFFFSRASIASFLCEDTIFSSETKLISNAECRIKRLVVSQGFQFGPAGIGVDVLFIAVIAKHIEIQRVVFAYFPLRAQTTPHPV